jgi:hypothetical protein
MRSTCILFRQTQQRSSCRSCLLITRAYAQETAQQQREYSPLFHGPNCGSGCDVQKSRNLSPLFPCRAASWLRSSARTAVPASPADLTLIECYLRNVRLGTIRFLAVGTTFIVQFEVSCKYLIHDIDPATSPLHFRLCID